MQKLTSSRKWASLEVPLIDFQHRVQQLQNEEGRSPTGSVLSRLALIHQVAKLYALDTLRFLGAPSADVAIDEITDPPLYDLALTEGVVIIQYSYEGSANADKSSQLAYP